MNSVPTTLTITNEADVRGQAIVDLIKTYVTIQGYYGFRSLGSNDITFPCFMVEPVREKLSMPTIGTKGKFRLELSYTIYWYCQDSDPDAIVRQATNVGEILAKLFSNNALGDSTPKFKQYPNPSGGYYWLNSEMSEISWSTSYINASPDNQQMYMRAGLMKFDIEDQLLK